MRQIIIHDAEEGGYWAEVPSLPGYVSEGETLEEVVANIKEAMELYIEGLIEDGQPVPND
jgi:predicted RNase H-like HicB family nuclease